MAPLPRIRIIYRGEEIGRSEEDDKPGVLYARTNFSRQINAVPGECMVTVRDPEHVYNFVTGGELVAYADDEKLWGGYVNQIGRSHFFPASPAPYWTLRGIDFNSAFDKRVMRNLPTTVLPSPFIAGHKPIMPNPYPKAHLVGIPWIPGDTPDGQVLRWLIELFADMEDFDTSEIHDTAPINAEDPEKHTYPHWAYLAQGSRIRQQFDGIAAYEGTMFYIDPDKKVWYLAFEEAVSAWGFSDHPDGVTSFGFREGVVTEDGSVITNDALIWGGSEFLAPTEANKSGGTKFYRAQDPDSQALHGRWQRGEVHFGEEGYGTAAQVELRAKAIVLGPPGATDRQPARGLRFPQWQANLAWFHHRTPGQIQPGHLVRLQFEALGVDQTLPLRSLRISFPTLKETGEAYVRYDGTFSLLPSDPFALWAILLRMQYRPVKAKLGATLDNSPTSVYGSFGQFTPELVSGLTYKIPFGYVAGTLLVYDPGGALLTPGLEVRESDPDAGEFTLKHSPGGGLMYATCRTLAG